MSASLEKKALSGGIVLVGRQLFGILLSLVGMLVTTRLLGPQKYGQFVIVSGLTGYAATVGKLGLDVYLIRHQGELDSKKVGVTQALYLAIGAFLAAATLSLGPVVAWYYHDPSLCRLFWSYALITPLTLLAVVPIALLDRQLLYKHAAMTELAGQLCYVALSVSIVWTTRSVWGVLIGVLGQAVTTLVLASVLSGTRLRPCWCMREAKNQIRYGLGYSCSIWIWQMRDLVNPVLVGKILGAEAAAFIAMAIRLSALVGFAKAAVWRVYMSYLARLADDREKMKEAIETSLSHQVLITGVSFIVFYAVSPDLIKGLMGQKWLPVLQVFPFIAAGVIANSGFSLYSSALYIIGKNNDVSVFHAAHIVLFGCAASLLSLRMNSIEGYGWAEIAALLSYFLIRYAFRKRLFPIRERLMYLNIVLFFGTLFIVMRLLAEPLWLRVAATVLTMLAILCVVPRNRSNCSIVLNMARQRLAGSV